MSRTIFQQFLNIYSIILTYPYILIIIHFFTFSMMVTTLVVFNITHVYENKVITGIA